MRKALPGRDFNLTAKLIERFPDTCFTKPTPFPQYLRELAEFYKKEMGSLYPEITLPNGEKGGILAALEKIRKDTGASVVWP